jgi:hypothetical protein
VIGLEIGEADACELSARDKSIARTLRSYTAKVAVWPIPCGLPSRKGPGTNFVERQLSAIHDLA